MITALLIFVLIMHSRINALQEETNVITHQDREITNLTNQMEKNILDMETGQRGYVITGNDKYLEPYLAGRIDLQNNYDELMSWSTEGSTQANRLASLKTNVDQWIASSSEPLITLKRDGRDRDVIAQYQTDDGINQMNQIRSQINEYRTIMTANTDHLIVRQAERNQLLIELLYLIWGLIALVTISAAWLMSRAISKPVQNITESISGFTSSRNLMSRIAITSNDEISDLGHVTNELLRSQQERIELQEHTNSMMSKYQGVQEIESLSDIFLSNLADKLHYPYAALYVRQEENAEDLMIRTAVYAGDAQLNVRTSFQMGEGLVGQCAKEAKLMEFRQVPENYVQVFSSLGTAPPDSLLLFPICFLGEVLAVAEIAAFSPLTPIQISYVESITEDFGAAINSTLNTMRIDSLLTESQRMNEELQVYTEELQTQSEELQMQSETLQLLNSKLEERQLIADEKTIEAQRAQAEMTTYSEMLERSTRYKSEFLANMSHELRTPLNGILLLSEFLKENNSNSLTTDELEYAQAIHSSGQDLLNLINDILDLSKVEAGKLNIEAEAVNVSEIPESVMQYFGEIAREKQIDLQVRVEETVPDIMFTDGQRLKQIINNLLSNALKFTSQGSVLLDIRMANEEELTETERLTEEPFLAFSIQDTGIGISEDKQSIIFEAFQQAEKDTERHYGGTGLGLSITKELTLLLDGHIVVESDIGRGSTFIVYLPVQYNPFAQHEQPITKDHVTEDWENSENKRIVATAESASLVEHDILKNKHVLLVDDDDRNLFALSKVLKAHHLDISIAKDGEQALLELEQSSAIDLVLMDIMMPVMDGYEAIQQIRLMEEYQNLPIIALTARAMIEDRKRIINAGATEYMSKPINMEQLLVIMRMLLANKN
ncbi:CHASE3 domain-containing protein [Paenibacillus taichungensis]|uniref:CHASE3 domain-containing protein n=1 Tax=Paenibacillus taichungensis TaxID=484184 RepID=UPI0038D099E8